MRYLHGGHDHDEPAPGVELPPDVLRSIAAELRTDVDPRVSGCAPILETVADERDIPAMSMFPPPMPPIPPIEYRKPGPWPTVPFAARPELHGGVPDLLPQSYLASSQNGRWEDAATWGGSLPIDGQSVVIHHDVTLQSQTARLDVVQVHGPGKLLLRNGFSLWVTTLYTMMDHGDGPGRICNETDEPVHGRITWARYAQDRVRDPKDWGGGLLDMGESCPWGHERQPFVALLQDQVAGDEWIELADVPIGWQVGDLILIDSGEQPQVNLQWQAFHPEERTIAELDGFRVRLNAPLDFDHTGPSDETGRIEKYQCCVKMLTHSIEIASEDPDRGGHIMHCGDFDSDWRNVAIVDPGRSLVCHVGNRQSLAIDAGPGDTTIRLAKAANSAWKGGTSIALTTGNGDYSWEEVVIQSLDSTRTVLALKAALKKPHWAGIDYAGTIVPTIDDTKYSPDGKQVTYLGANNKGTYGKHYHKSNATKHYAKNIVVRVRTKNPDGSVYNTRVRWLCTFHSTVGGSVDGIVTYHHAGAGIYFETGDTHFWTLKRCFASYQEPTWNPSGPATNGVGGSGITAEGHLGTPYWMQAGNNKFVECYGSMSNQPCFWAEPEGTQPIAEFVGQPRAEWKPTYAGYFTNTFEDCEAYACSRLQWNGPVGHAGRTQTRYTRCNAWHVMCGGAQYYDEGDWLYEDGEIISDWRDQNQDHFGLGQGGGGICRIRNVRVRSPLPFWIRPRGSGSRLFVENADIRAPQNVATINPWTQTPRAVRDALVPPEPGWPDAPWRFCNPGEKGDVEVHIRGLAAKRSVLGVPTGKQAVDFEFFKPWKPGDQIRVYVPAGPMLTYTVAASEIPAVIDGFAIWWNAGPHANLKTMAASRVGTSYFRLTANPGVMGDHTRNSMIWGPTAQHIARGVFALAYQGLVFGEPAQQTDGSLPMRVWLDGTRLWFGRQSDDTVITANLGLPAAATGLTNSQAEAQLGVRYLGEALPAGSAPFVPPAGLKVSGVPMFVEP